VRISDWSSDVCSSDLLTPDDDGWPEDGYRGDYFADVARAFLDGASVEVEGRSVSGNGDADDLDAIRHFAVAWLRNEQNGDLAAFGVSFDVYFLESSLYADRSEQRRAGKRFVRTCRSRWSPYH